MTEKISERNGGFWNLWRIQTLGKGTTSMQTFG